jgi:SAM-dependent methyltransferase
MSTDINAAQIEYWNEVSGPKWVRLQEELDEQLKPLEDALLAQVDLRAGHSVLDVGCGCGATSLALADRVGTSGAVTGIDVSQPMIAHGESHVGERSNINFVMGDAQVWTLPTASYDHIVSRFGVMFFGDPVAAFTNLRAHLKPGGRFSFICWRAFADNPWMTVPVEAAGQHVPMPLDGDPYAPGPAALADAERTERLLREAGFTEVRIAPNDQDLHIGPGGTLDASVDFAMKMGPVPRMIADADEETIAKVRAAIREALMAHDGEDGVRLRSATWIVQAKG